MTTAPARDFVIVTPLEPPFTQPVVHITFADDCRVLAVSKADAAKLQALMGSDPVGRMVKLSAANDGVRVRVDMVRS